MKNTDFMKALGKVDARYVEETLNARESGERHILRWNPLPAIGVLSGAAVCAAMVLTIIAVKNPSGEAMKPYTSGESAVGTQVSVDEAVIHATDDGYTYCDPNSATNIYDFNVVDGTVTALGLQLDVKRLAENTTGHYVAWRLETAAGEFVTDAIGVGGLNEGDPEASRAASICEIGKTWRAEVRWYKDGVSLGLQPGNYNLVLYATDEDGKEILPADAKYIPFSYGTTTVTDTNGNPYTQQNHYEALISEESITEKGLRLNLSLPEETPEDCYLLWSLWDYPPAGNENFLTKGNHSEAPILIPAGSIGTQTFDISWSDYKGSLNPMEIEDGSYLLDITVIHADPAASHASPVYAAKLQFYHNVDVPIVSTTSEPTTTTTATDTEVVIHFPADPYVESTTTTTAVTAPAEYNDGKVRVIAEFRETMGKEPAVLSDEEAAKITSLIDGLSLIPSTKSYGDAYAQERTGGPYLIYANGKRYELWDETMIRYDGNYYVMTKDGDTKGGKALLDEVIAMVMKYQP